MTPDSYRGGGSVMTMLTITNSKNQSVPSVEVELKVNSGAAQKKNISVPATGRATVVFIWMAPSSGTATLTAMVNPAKTVVEADYTNNTLVKTVSIHNGSWPTATEQPTPVAIPSTPAGDRNPSIDWTETFGGTDKSYYANLSLTATPSTTNLKSGYGFEVTVKAKVDTNYPVAFEPTQVLMFIPERGFKEVVRLVRSGDKWMLPVSPYSKIGAKKWYIPVWWPDGKAYEAIITAYGASTPKGELIASAKISIQISGSMYEDDSTNNMR
jgi:hypothetical protein